MLKRDYCYGIYQYTDKENGEIVYIGKDSHIDKNRRHKEHFHQSQYNKQQINRILQNNPKRYKYSVWYHVSNIDELNQLEFDLINLYRPKFNFQHGGHGKPTNKEFKYTVIKGGNNHQGNKRYLITDINRKPIVSSIDYDYVDNICKKLNTGELTPKKVKQLKKKVTHSEENKIKFSKISNSSGFYCVYKKKDCTCKQGFLWSYPYYDENSKRKDIKRVNLFDLKKAVEEKGLTWQCVDVDKAINTIKVIYNIM